MTTCSRPGCTKTLRSNNTTGKCATGCESPEAPPAKRTTPKRERPATPSSSPGTALERFDAVARALGKDPSGILEEFAQAWLDALAEKLED